MKKLIGLLTMAVFILGLTSLATATTYTIPMADLDNAHFIDQGWGVPSETSRSPNTPWPGWERYYIDQPGKVGIGDSFDYNNVGWSNNAGFGIASMPIDGGGMGDLSTYSAYALMFHNPNDSSIDVNVFMNTGWTDGNLEPDYFWQNGWTSLDAGQTKTVTLDFSNAEYFYGGVGASADLLLGNSGTGGAIINLNHVSNIGFQAIYNNPNESWQVDVAPVPEPCTMLLFGTGLVGLAGLGRKRFFKK